MDKFENVLGKMAEIKKDGAEMVVSATLGDVVLELLTEKQSFTLDDLLLILRRRIEESPSANGGMSADQDTERLRAEAVIQRLQKLTGHLDP